MLQVISKLLHHSLHVIDMTASYRLNASNAIRGAYGMLHLDTADWNGQKPVVRTRTKRSTPFRLACNKNQLCCIYCSLQTVLSQKQTKAVNVYVT